MAAGFDSGVDIFGLGCLENRFGEFVLRQRFATTQGEPPARPPVERPIFFHFRHDLLYAHLAADNLERILGTCRGAFSTGIAPLPVDDRLTMLV